MQSSDEPLPTIITKTCATHGFSLQTLMKLHFVYPYTIVHIFVHLYDTLVAIVTGRVGWSGPGRFLWRGQGWSCAVQRVGQALARRTDTASEACNRTWWQLKKNTELNANMSDRKSYFGRSKNNPTIIKVYFYHPIKFMYILLISRWGS